MMTTLTHIQLLKAISFAAEKHRQQTRKDGMGTPYINHPVTVALTLADAGEHDVNLLVAAVLHDTIEDTDTTEEEIRQHFGDDVLTIVLEVTDDKSLSKEERKRLQVSKAAHKSPLAKKLKLADKICNVNDIIHRPPHNWSVQRKLEYLLWAEQVLVGLRGTNAQLEQQLMKYIEEGRALFHQKLSEPLGI